MLNSLVSWIDMPWLSNDTIFAGKFSGPRTFSSRFSYNIKFVVLIEFMIKKWYISAEEILFFFTTIFGGEFYSKFNNCNVIVVCVGNTIWSGEDDTVFIDI